LEGALLSGAKVNVVAVKPAGGGGGGETILGMPRNVVLGAALVRFAASTHPRPGASLLFIG
jgi:hypothetical protein